MDRKSQSLQNTLKAFDELEGNISGMTIESPPLLARAMNNLVESLRLISEEGSTMDESSLLQIPLELFDHIAKVPEPKKKQEITLGPSAVMEDMSNASDIGESNNPELYLLGMLQNCEQKSKQLSNRINYLQTVKEKTTQAIGEAPATPSLPANP